MTEEKEPGDVAESKAQTKTTSGDTTGVYPNATGITEIAMGVTEDICTSQISEFILDKGYTTYFRLQSALAELTDSGLLKIELTHNRTLYNLTEEGAATINYFRNKISPEIRQEIDNFINEKKYDLKEEVSVKSDYYLNTNHEYEVKCQILENGSHLIDMTLTVPTQTEAEAIVNNWNRKNQEIYALLLSQLL